MENVEVKQALPICFCIDVQPPEAARTLHIRISVDSEMLLRKIANLKIVPDLQTRLGELGYVEGQDYDAQALFEGQTFDG